MTKILLIGLGRWGANHLRVLNSLPVEVFAADLHPLRLEAARNLGMAADHLTTNYKDFAPLVDAVVVVTPAQMHFELSAELIETGKDVFVEKPMTLNSVDALALAQLAEAKRRILQVGHILRFDPATEWLRDAIRWQRFGRVQMMRANFSGFKRPRPDSGILFADAVHLVDLFNHFMSGLPRSVAAITRDFLSRGMEDASLLSLEYDTPHGVAWGVIETNYLLPGKIREVAITGSKYSARCDFTAKAERLRTFANRHVKSGNLDFKAEAGLVSVIELPTVEPLMRELKAFVASVETRNCPAADGWAGYHSVRVIEAALESARIGRPVVLE